MNTKFYGIMSLVLFFAAIVIGLYVMARAQTTMAIVYFGIIVVGMLAILYFFCGKCPCRDESCAHVLPGYLSNIYPKRKQEPYTKTDLAITVIFLLLLIAVPQKWLFTNMRMFLMFWIFILGALVQIRLRVCVACSNKNCPGHPGGN